MNGCCPTCGCPQQGTWDQQGWGGQQWAGPAWGGPMMGGHMMAAPMMQGPMMGGPMMQGGWACGPGWGAGPAMAYMPGYAPGYVPGYPPGYQPGYAPGYAHGYTAPHYGGLPTDEEIEEMIYDAVDADPLIPFDANVDISVEAGTVYLRGEVPSKRIKHAAGDDAWWIPGVVDVHNEIRIATRRHERGGEQTEGMETQDAQAG